MTLVEKNEIAINRVKEIALKIKLDVVRDLDISDERFNGICEGLDRVINTLKGEDVWQQQK